MSRLPASSCNNCAFWSARPRRWRDQGMGRVRRRRRWKCFGLRVKTVRWPGTCRTARTVGPAISATGVPVPRRCRTSGVERCLERMLGRIGSCRGAQPGRKHHRKVTTTVRITARLRRFAGDLHRISQDAPGAFVMRREENTTSSEVNGWPSARRCSATELMLQAVGGWRRAFGEPRLDLLRRAIHLEQARLRQGRDYVRGSIIARVPVERLRLGSDRDTKVSATGDALRGDRRRKVAGRLAAPNRRRGQDRGQEPGDVALLSGQKLAREPTS